MSSCAEGTWRRITSSESIGRRAAVQLARDLDAQLGHGRRLGRATARLGPRLVRGRPPAQGAALARRRLGALRALLEQPLLVERVRARVLLERFRWRARSRAAARAVDVDELREELVDRRQHRRDRRLVADVPAHERDERGELDDGRERRAAARAARGRVPRDEQLLQPRRRGRRTSDMRRT